MKKTGIAITIAMIIAGALFAMPSNSESISRTVHFSPQSTNNNTSIPSIETQMNTFVFGLGAGLGNLATFAYQNSTRANPSTMLQDMEIFVYSPGNSTANIYFNGKIDTTAVFSWSTPNGIYTVAPSNAFNLTIVIGSALLGMTRTITYNISVLTTQQFISYEKQVLSPHTTVPSDVLYGLVAFTLLMTMGALRGHLPFARVRIRKRNMDQGMRRIA